MQPGVLRALEFDRIVEAVRGFALTPMGDERLARLAAVDRSATGRAAARRDDRDGTLPRQARRCSRCARRATCRRSSTRSPSRGGALEALRLLALADVSRFGRRDARRRSAASPASFPLLEQASGRRRVVQGRDRADARQDRSVGRRRRPREPGAASSSASGCASSGRGCAARSSRICAARTRRSTCRIRSSPSGTAATCSS